MCGVYGYIASSPDDRPNLKTLRKLARVTEQRGPHAFGMAWLDGAGRMRSYRQAGRVSDYLPLLDMVRDARMLIAHCRWTTHGTEADNINNHPHPCDAGWIVHNGVIANYRELQAEHDLYTSSACDTEVLARLIESLPGRIMARVGLSVVQTEPRPLVMLGLWKPGRLVAVRRGNPLHRGLSPEGVYLASLPEGLPGEVEIVPDQSMTEWTFQQGASYGKTEVLPRARRQNPVAAADRRAARGVAVGSQRTWGF